MGDQLTSTVSQDGELLLEINDDNLSDNSGSVVVRIELST
jgi:hypothetical protein